MDELLTRLARLDHVSGELAWRRRSATHAAACSDVTGPAAGCARWRFPGRSTTRPPSPERRPAQRGMDVCLNSLSSGQST